MISFTGYAAETVETVLTKALEALNNAPAIKGEYVLTGADGSNGGVIILSGNKFTIKGDGIATWYDGKTMWAYSESTGEVNITEPTDDELAEINPLVILNSDPDAYTVRLKKKSKTDFVLELTDQTDGGMSISHAIITLSACTYLPINATVRTSSGERCNLEFKNLKKLNSVETSAFTFNPKEYPGVDVIDLR